MNKPITGQGETARTHAVAVEDRREAAAIRIKRADFLLMGVAATAFALLYKSGIRRTLGEGTSEHQPIRESAVDRKQVFENIHRGNQNTRQRKGIFMYFDDFDKYNSGIGFDKALDNTAYAGFNIILPEVITSSGLANYRNGMITENPDIFSRVGPGKDPLKELIDRAERRGIRVWPWIMLFVGNEELRRKHPEWFAVSAYGRHSNFMDFLNPGARTFQIEAIAHLVREYRIQGINLDIELPIDHISYSDRKGPGDKLGDKQRFMAENDIAGIKWPGDVLEGGRYNGLWLEWTNGKIANFLNELARKVRQERKDLVISYDVTRDPDDPRYYSNWPSWLRRNPANILSPMIYQWDSHLNRWQVDSIIRRDMLLTMKDRKMVELISVVGGSLYATREVSASQLAESVKNAMTHNSNKSVNVFCYEVVDKANAWRDVREALRE